MRLSLVHWLIAIAVLANGAVYYWQQTQPEATPAADLGGGLRELKLLSEVEQADASTAAPSAPDSFETAEPTELPTPAPAPEPEPVAEAVDTAELAPAEPVVVTMADDAVPETDLALPAAREPEPLEPEPAPRCWLAGPVANDALSEQLTVAFAAAGVSMDLVLQTTEVSPDNWVYLPTSGEQADVRRLSRELRQGGMDNFPITDGPLAGSLSMGLFRSEERAIAVRDTLRSRGYQADIFKRPAFAEQPWISLDDRARVALDWPALEGNLPGYEALRLLSVECPSSS